MGKLSRAVTGGGLLAVGLMVAAWVECDDPRRQAARVASEQDVSQRGERRIRTNSARVPSEEPLKPRTIPAASATVPAPSISEGAGALRRLWDMLAVERVDEITTERELAWALEQMSNHGVRARSQHLHCSATLCRADLVFDDIRGARDLAGIVLPDGFQVAYGRPEPASQDGVRIVVYWGAGGSNLSALLDQ